LKFITNDSVSIASASGTADPNSYVPGKADVSVTASGIGSDSNLSAGTQFRIGSFSTLDYVAKNSEALSGGSSRQAQSVSKNDIAALRTELTSSLKEEIKNKLLDLIPGDSYLVDGSIQTQITSEKFSHTEGTISDQLNLELTVQAAGITLQKSDIKNLVTSQIEGLIPAGFSQKNEPEFQYALKNYAGDQANVEVNLSSTLLPVFDIDKVVNDLPGKKPTQARDYLLNLPGVSRVDFTFSVPLPANIITLPHIRNNIHLEIVSG
jgi:hypothetical protein